MDDRVADIDAKRSRVQAGLVWTGVGALIYVVLLIAVLSQLRTPLPAWVPLLWIPLPLVVIAVPALRMWRASLNGQMLRAQADATRKSIDALEAEQNKRRKRQ
jgi:uncharacterized protein (DUF983 family)